MELSAAYPPHTIRTKSNAGLWQTFDSLELEADKPWCDRSILGDATQRSAAAINAHITRLCNWMRFSLQHALVYVQGETLVLFAQR